MMKINDDKIFDPHLRPQSLALSVAEVERFVVWEIRVVSVKSHRGHEELVQPEWPGSSDFNLKIFLTT